MKLYLVRHGETNSKSLNHGRFNTGLSDKGIEQSKRVGLFLKDKNIDSVFCSELERAKQTLEQIKPFIKKAKIIFTSDINELSKGIYKTNEEYKQALKQSGLKDHEFRPEKGENYFDVEKRAKDFWNFLKKNHSKDTVLVIGHGIFLRLLILRMLNLHMKEMAYFDLENGSISYFEEESGKIIKSVINNCQHLVNFSSYPRDRYYEGTNEN